MTKREKIMNYSLVAIEGDKFQMKAWDHENNCSVVTTAIYLGECDHPDWGTAIRVSYKNPDCHLEDFDDIKETETDIPVAQFNKAIVSVEKYIQNTIKKAETDWVIAALLKNKPLTFGDLGQYTHEESQATS